jgi:cytochrome oxidase assembly protein ShyY1
VVSRYRFLGQPRWLLFTALIAGLVVLMVNLAFWQLRRLDARRDLNHQIVAREAEPVAPLGEVLGQDASADDVAAAAWRHVTATGAYDPAEEVLIRNRDFAGHPGYHVVTPLRLHDGSAVLVNRGWIPLEADDQDGPTIPPPPSGTVTVNGRVRATQQKGRFFSPSDPPEGHLSQLYRVDVPRIGQQVAYPLVPVYLELVASEPAPGAGQPELIPPPVLDEGPHLSYAGQWFLFSACAVVGWLLVVRRTARSRQREAAGVAEQPRAPDEAATGAA